MSIHFSVIIPTLNEEKYLPLLLSDLKNQQKAKTFEVIVVDGKSDDKTKEVALSFQKDFPLTFLESEKRNVAYQRNSGARSAIGDVLVFLDADTRIPKNFLFELYKDCFLRHFLLVLPSITWEDTTRQFKMLQSFVKSLIRASHVYGKPLATGGNIIVEKKVFEKLNGFNEDLLLSEDHDFVRRAHDMHIKARIPKNLKVTISLRRSKAEGEMALISKYIIAFLIYTMSPNEKMLKKKIFDYEMGGQKYANLDEKEKEKVWKKLFPNKNLDQFNKFLVALRFFNRM